MAISPVFKLVPGCHTAKMSGSDFITGNADYKGMQLAFTFKLGKVKYGITLYRYDSTMKLVKEYKLQNGEKQFGPFPAELRQYGSRFYLLYYTYDEETNSLKLFLAPIDPVTLEPGTAISFSK